MITRSDVRTRGILTLIFLTSLLPCAASQTKDELYCSTLLSLARLFPNNEKLVPQKALLIDVFTRLYTCSEIPKKQRDEVRTHLAGIITAVKKIHAKLLTSSEAQEVTTTATLYQARASLIGLFKECECSQEVLKDAHLFIITLQGMLLHITRPLHWHRWGRYVPMLATLVVFGYVLYTTYVGNQYLQEAIAEGIGKSFKLWGALCDKWIKGLKGT